MLNADIRTKFKKLFPTISIHGLRHSFISYLISIDIDIYTIAKFVGHSKPTMILKIYGHLYKEKYNNSVTKVNENIGKKSNTLVRKSNKNTIKKRI